MIKQKRSTENEIKAALREATVNAWDAGYKAGESGKKDDCKPAVVESIISDAWDKVRGSINDLLDAVGDWIEDQWTDAKNKIKEMWGDIIPWN